MWNDYFFLTNYIRVLLKFHLWKIPYQILKYSFNTNSSNYIKNSILFSKLFTILKMIRSTKLKKKKTKKVNKNRVIFLFTIARHGQVARKKFRAKVVSILWQTVGFLSMTYSIRATRIWEKFWGGCIGTSFGFSTSGTKVALDSQGWAQAGGDTYLTQDQQNPAEGDWKGGFCTGGDLIYMLIDDGGRCRRVHSLSCYSFTPS